MPSYRCQQLRRNYIKYTYTLLRQPVLLPIHAITGGQLLLYTPDKQPDRQTAHRQTDRLEHLIIPSPTDRIGVGNFIIIMQASILYSRWTFWSWTRASQTCVRLSSWWWPRLSRWIWPACRMTASLISSCVASGWRAGHSGVCLLRLHMEFSSRLWAATLPSSTRWSTK